MPDFRQVGKNQQGEDQKVDHRYQLIPDQQVAAVVAVGQNTANQTEPSHRDTAQEDRQTELANRIG